MENKLTQKLQNRKEVHLSSGPDQAVTRQESHTRPNTVEEVVISDSEEGAEGTNDWQIVSGKKRRRSHNTRPLVLSGQSTQIGTLQGMQKKKYLHVWSLHRDTATDTIKSHVIATCETDDVTVDQIHPRIKRDYSSFRIGVPENQYKKIYNKEVWPINTRISEWVWHQNFRSHYTQKSPDRTAKDTNLLSKRPRTAH